MKGTDAPEATLARSKRRSAKLSAEGRKRIIEATKKRWARVRAEATVKSMK